MAREFKEVAKFKTDHEAYSQNYEHIFGGNVAENIVATDKVSEPDKWVKHHQECIELSRERENILTEALEYILTFKHPEYMSKSRGSVFDVARKALRHKIAE